MSPIPSREGDHRMRLSGWPEQTRRLTAAARPGAFRFGVPAWQDRPAYDGVRGASRAARTRRREVIEARTRRRGCCRPHHSGHSAAAPALGYAAQIEHGLLTLLGFAFREPASLSLEVLDDIEALTGRERAYIQIKNKPGTARSLTDSAEDLWSSLDNWLAAWLERSAEETQRFCLVTTQTAAANSALAMLRRAPCDRSPEEAAYRLQRAARRLSQPGHSAGP